jgi:hypothetical protein
MNVQDDSALRSLDAAATSLTAEERERAEATLEWIVAAAPTTGAPQPMAPAPARRARRRLVLIPAAALALIVGSVVFQGVGGDNAAYASWTPTPTPVTGDDLHTVASACRDELDRYAYSMDAGRAKLALAERRGDYVAVLYRTDVPDMSGYCLVRNPLGSADAEVVGSGAAGSSGPAEKAPPRGFTQGAIFGSEGASITDGAVGDEVKGVTIHAGALTVEASVHNGRYAAWWPGPAFESGPPPPSGKGGPEPILTYDLTLNDGTVIHNAQPTLPS